MLVVHVIARMNQGGTAKYLFTLCDQLNKIGVESIIICGSVQDGEVEDSRLGDFKYIRSNNLGRKISLIKDLLACYELRKMLINLSPDVIHSHTFKAGLLVRIQKNSLLAKLNSKTRFVHTFHGHLFDDPSFNWFKLRAIISIEKKLARRTDVIITVGKNIMLRIAAHRIRGQEPTISIPPSVPPLSLSKKSLSLKKFADLKSNRFRILWMARVTKVKNPMRLVRIASAVPEADFYIAGDGDMLDELKKQKLNNLKILGWQRPEFVLPLGDLFLSTSDNEGIPISIIEAQQAGIPVVATNVGSVSEIVLDKQTGLICNKDDNELIQAVKLLMVNKTLLARYSKNAKNHSKTIFNQNNFLNSHLHAYLKTASSRD